MHFNYNFVKLNFLQPVLHPLEIILICWFGAYKNRIIIMLKTVEQLMKLSYILKSVSLTLQKEICMAFFSSLNYWFVRLKLSFCTYCNWMGTREQRGHHSLVGKRAAMACLLIFLLCPTLESRTGLEQIDDARMFISRWTFPLITNPKRSESDMALSL